MKDEGWMEEGEGKEKRGGKEGRKRGEGNVMERLSDEIGRRGFDSENLKII